MQLQSHSEVVADILLAVIRGYVVHLSVEIKGQYIAQTGVHREVRQGKVRRSLSDRKSTNFMKKEWLVRSAFCLIVY